MQVPYHRLMPTRPFFGVTEGFTMPIGVTEGSPACHLRHQGQLQDEKPQLRRRLHRASLQRHPRLPRLSKVHGGNAPRL
jgi:hypothetical protein